MFIEQAIKIENKFWKYIVGSLVIIIISSFGQAPFAGAIFLKTYLEGKDFTKLDEKQMMTYLDLNLTLFLLMLTFVFGLLGIYIVIKNLHKQTVLSLTTSRKAVDWSRFWFSFLLWGSITVISTLALYFEAPENFVLNFKLVPFLILFVLGIILIPLQTSCEEYVFRGYLMQGFGAGTLNKKFQIGILYTFIFIPIYLFFEFLIKVQFNFKIPFLTTFIVFFSSILFLFLIDFILTKLNLFESNFYNKLYQNGKNKFIPLLMTSVIFGGMHYFNPEVEKMGNIVMIYYIGTGFMLGIMTLMDEGMELALGFHAANNLVSALLVTADWSAFQTHSILKDISEPSAGFDIIAPVFIVYPIILFIFSKKYGWTNWKEKLTGSIEIENNASINEISGNYDTTNLQ